MSSNSFHLEKPFKNLGEITDLTEKENVLKCLYKVHSMHYKTDEFRVKALSHVCDSVEELAEVFTRTRAKLASSEETPRGGYGTPNRRLSLEVNSSSEDELEENDEEAAPPSGGTRNNARSRKASPAQAKAKSKTAKANKAKNAKEKPKAKSKAKNDAIEYSCYFSCVQEILLRAFRQEQAIGTFILQLLNKPPKKKETYRGRYDAIEKLFRLYEWQAFVFDQDTTNHIFVIAPLVRNAVENYFEKKSPRFDQKHRAPCVYARQKGFRRSCSIFQRAQGGSFLRALD